MPDDSSSDIVDLINIQHLHFASQADADANLIENQIADLQCRRRLTPNQQSSLRSLFEQRNALRSPVYKLPDDVLMYIFEVGAASDASDEGFAVLVSHVVSRWRRVALATPRLWSSILIELPFFTNRRIKGPVETTIDRAGDTPIRLTVLSTDIIPNYPSDSRWPLELITIEAQRRSRLSRNSADLVFGLLPRCETISLIGIELGDTVLRFTDRLRYLNMRFTLAEPPSGYPFQFLLDALEVCSTLEHLSLSRILRADGPDDHAVKDEDRIPRRYIKLLSLRTLFLEDSTSQPCPLYGILQGIEANLQRLAVVGHYQKLEGFPFKRLTVSHLVIGLRGWEQWFLSPANTTLRHVKVLQLYRAYLPDHYIFVNDISLLPHPMVLQVDKLEFDSPLPLGNLRAHSAIGPTLTVGGLGINAREVYVITRGLRWEGRPPRDHSDLLEW